ncbi:hypothetical protein YC2023_108263 [Brassica napus]
MSLPVVHTAHRSYRLNDPVKCSDHGEVGGSPPAMSREKDHCRTLEIERPENDESSLSVGRFRISPNPSTKSVKENATKQPAFANLETVFVRKQCCNVKSKTTLGNGYLGSRIDEELAPQAFWPRARLPEYHKSSYPHPLEDMGRKLISRVLPHASDVPVQKVLMTRSPQRDPSLEKRPQRWTRPKFPGKGHQRG